MCSRFLDLLLLALLPAAAGAAELRVCADPDNLPYSNRAGQGFENRIAQLVAEDIGASLSYYWQEQGRGFVRKTLGEGHCDLFVGVPAGFDRVLRTKPYYRSTYVAVYRAGAPGFAGFDPAALRQRRIGVQLIGNDLAASPPGYALTRIGITGNVTGFPMYGDGPAAQRMIGALEQGSIDLALLWGPQAGYYAHRAGVPMALALLARPEGLPVPFEYSIAMGVRKGDTALRDRLDDVLERRRAEVDAILADYFVPRVPMARAGGQP